MLKKFKQANLSFREKMTIFFLNPTYTLQLIPPQTVIVYKCIFWLEFSLSKLCLSLNCKSKTIVGIFKAGIILYALNQKSLENLMSKAKDQELKNQIEMELTLSAYYLKSAGESKFEDSKYWSITEDTEIQEAEIVFDRIFWFLGHKAAKFALDTVMRNVSTLKHNSIDSLSRNLPHFTSNLGHLGYLFLYINYYRTRDSNRVIHVTGEKIANRFYFEIIRRLSPLKIVIDSPNNINRDFLKTDFLLMSRDSSGKYRAESSAASLSFQEFPEFQVCSDFQLKLTDDENLQGLTQLNEFLGREITWFGLIHVRGPRNGNFEHAQARDANIDRYRRIGEFVNHSGGLLIRMGDDGFPRLKRNFVAFDYAHSDLRSEFMDVWFWNNCRFWVGNMNGASVPPLTFGKRRLLTDMWFIDENGPSSDFYVPKKLFYKGQRLACDEIKNLPISRVMNRKWIKHCGYDLEDLSEIELQQAFSRFFETLCTSCTGLQVNSIQCADCNKNGKRKVPNIMQLIEL